MRRFFTWEYLAVFIPALALAVGAVWFTLRYVKPAPPDSFVLAAASKGSPYNELALRLKQEIEKKGVKLELRETQGSLENLRLLNDGASDVQAGIVQGGLTNHIESPTLFSMGRLITEPVWIFYRGDATLTHITDLKGKRILTGPKGSGTEVLAKRLLDANGITPDNSTLIASQLPDYVETFVKGDADAGFLVLGPEARTVERLLHQDGTKLMSMAQADALIQRYPYLTQVTMRRGVIDFAQNIPPVDTVLVSTKAMLLVSDDLHPALLAILAQAVLKVQSQPTLKPSGESKLFALGPESLTDDPEFPMIDDATRVYKNGPTFFQRILPFWLATLIDRAAILILPMIGVVIPLARIVPLLYNWRMRQRILHWYRELKRIEKNLTHKKASAEFISQKERDLDRVEEAVWRISVPTHLSADLYTLRDNVEFVRRRIVSLREGASRSVPAAPAVANEAAHSPAEPALETGA
ncbi:TAXI family TRAP transporter solute-binding subunit [Rhodomicrobium sp.]|uniref:TAXI family TRAP transporter solute-binding subunit n=1 Tax=Rhodomicrobium sp. TaxID=2720632 RepID=UPI0039E3F617